MRHPRSDRPRRGVQPKLRYLERGRFEDRGTARPTIPVAPMTIFKPDIRPFLLADEGTWQHVTMWDIRRAPDVHGLASRSLGQTHQAVQAVHETAALRDFLDGQNDARHERLARCRVMPERQDLPEAAKDDLLVGNQAGRRTLWTWIPPQQRRARP